VNFMISSENRIIHWMELIWWLSFVDC
jgi:hypothetical protein